MIVVKGMTARDDSFQEVRRLSLDHVHRSRTEPGCLSHAVDIDCENPFRLVFVERWADQAALNSAFRADGFARFRPRFATAGRGCEIYDATAVSL
jgi:quinol monooxygenase YgiN